MLRTGHTWGYRLSTTIQICCPVWLLCWCPNIITTTYNRLRAASVMFLSMVPLLSVKTTSWPLTAFINFLRLGFNLRLSDTYEWIPPSTRVFFKYAHLKSDWMGWILRHFFIRHFRANRSEFLIITSVLLPDVRCLILLFLSPSTASVRFFGWFSLRFLRGILFPVKSKLRAQCIGLTVIWSLVKSRPNNNGQNCYT